MFGVLVRLLLVLAAVLAAGPARAQLCGPTDDPCVVTESINVPGDTIVDLGERDLVIAAQKNITVLGTGTGGFSVMARNITFEVGARIIAGGVVGFGGFVQLTASEAVDMQADSRIIVVGGYGGDVVITAASAVLGGQIRADATNALGDGGYVDIKTTGDLLVGGGVFANGGTGDSYGGDIFLTANGDLEVTAPVEAKGGSGSDIDLYAGGAVTLQATSTLNNIASYEGNDAGDVSILAGGTVSLLGQILGRGAGGREFGGGDGGFVDVTGTRVVVGGLVELTGGAPDGDGGFFDVTGAPQDVVMVGSVVATGGGQALGGDILLSATSGIGLHGSVDVRGGYAGGSFEAETSGLVEVGSAAVVDASFIPGYALGGYGGIVIVSGCAVTVPFGARFDATGKGNVFSPRGTVRIASDQTTVGGSLVAGVGVTLRYRVTAPAILGSAIIQPWPPTLAQDVTLPCCGPCPTTTTTSSTTSTTTSSTTSTSTTTTTSVSTAPPSSTTSTSVTTSTTETSTTTTSSTTSTTSSTSTSTTSTSTSSSSVTTVASTTTSTTLPLSCLDEPLEGYAAVECAIGHLQDMLASQSEEALGGSKSAKRLAGKIEKTWALVEKSRTSGKSARLLAKAERKVFSFEKQIARLLAKAKIDDALATNLLDLSDEISVRIDGVLTPPAN